MLARLRALFAPRPAAPDPVVTILQAEIACAREREKALLEQIRDLTNKLSALADTKAHLAATREPAPAPPERKPPSLRVPAYVQHSVGQGHVDLKAVRATHAPRAMSKVPPVVRE